MKKFDLIIIGGGAGAFAAAIRANELKVKTAIINAGLPLGGTCVNVGCLPSKILLHAGEILHMAKNHNVDGIELEIKKFDFNKVIKDEMKMVEISRKDKYEKVLTGLEYVSLIKGYAKFTGEKEVEAGGDKFSAEKFIIATGSTANVPLIKNIKEVGFITHIEALQLEKQPKELVIVGGGPVGLEFAQMYSRFGTKVTILQKGKSVFGGGEPEIINRLTEVLQNEGIVIRTNVDVKSTKKENGKKIVTFEINGNQEEVSADEILLAAGKTPNTKDLGFANIDIKTDDKQAIIVDNFFQTNRSHVFAIGDVSNAPLRLETTAGHEGTLVVDNAMSGANNSINYNSVPYTIFTNPQFASVGWTEERQIKETGACACRTVSFEVIPKAQIIRRTEGLIKMGIDPKTKQILGVHILSPNAGDLIAQATVLIKNKNTIDDILHSMPVFPTLSESFKYAALAFT